VLQNAVFLSRNEGDLRKSAAAAAAAAAAGAGEGEEGRRGRREGRLDRALN
jgi:hypothetical protein